MPDEPIPSFEHEALEADIRQLAQEIRRHREAPETKNLGEKELLRHALRVFPRGIGQAVPAQPTAAAKLQSSKSPLPDYAQSAPAEVKLEIEYLLDMAFHGGLAKAAAEARKSPDFVQDAFHDALAGKLYPELQRRGILK